jgi:hypothetical protein
MKKIEKRENTPNSSGNKLHMFGVPIVMAKLRSIMFGVLNLQFSQLTQHRLIASFDNWFNGEITPSVSNY